MALLEAPLSSVLNGKGGGDITVIDGTSLLSETGPVGTVADIDDRQPANQISIYVVREGDTLSEIANMFDVSVNTILWANDIPGKVIKKGQTLVILPVSGIRYSVKKGDTIAAIAKKYKADAEEIREYNGLVEGAALAVGDTLVIPDGEMATPAPSSSRGAKTPYLGGGGPKIDGYYGVPVYGAHRSQERHGYNGIDLAAPVGTPIIASAEGHVIAAKSGGWNAGYGNYVVVRHANGTQTLYAHASRVLVYVGQHVLKGEKIAEVGSTGNSTGPHLHFEIRNAYNICSGASNICTTH